jgi:serine/threonine-protein kinase ULK/ATG1
MEYCSGRDFTNYMKKRGRVENLEYIPEPGAAPQYYPHLMTGGLAEIILRIFLRHCSSVRVSWLSYFPTINHNLYPQRLHSSSFSNETCSYDHRERKIWWSFPRLPRTSIYEVK